MLPPSVHESAGRRRLKNTPLMSAVAKALKRAGRASRYRLRQQVVEPVFGQMRQARGFRQFLLRGLDQVRGEWAMICTARNLRKLAQAAGRCAMPAPPGVRAPTKIRYSDTLLVLLRHERV